MTDHHDIHPNLAVTTRGNLLSARAAAKAGRLLADSPLSRRRVLGGAVSAGGAVAMAGALSGFNAFAADTSDYKALVCLFFLGGLDCHDAIIPFDTASYNTWSNGRSALVGRYSGANSRARSNILQMKGTNDGRQFAMAPELNPLHQLYQQGHVAVAANVGPLIEPANRQQVQAKSVRVPPRIASHNDQQSIWMSSRPEGAQEGWGGRFADIQNAAGANSDTSFAAIGVDGINVFVSGRETLPLFVGQNGAPDLRGTSGSSYGSGRVPGLVKNHYRDAGATRRNLFARDYMGKTDRAFRLNDRIRGVFGNASTGNVSFPDTALGRKLQTVLKLISQRGELGARRQVFFVQMGGFDTHSGQSGTLPRLQAEIAGAMAAFYAGTEALGIQNNVTTFTGSDFGRTLTSNGDGTDHGWGGHHFVMGGAVSGGRIVGRMPDSGTGHDQDRGQGRLIPTMAVDQYAASLGRWFGLSEGELADVLPGLRNFNANAVDFFA